MAYTPFLANIGRGISQKREQSQLNQLVGDAYLGDPQAMEELMRFNPQAGVKLQQIQQKRKESEKQKQLESKTRFDKDLDEFRNNVASYPDFESAKPYMERGIGVLAENYPALGKYIQQEGLDEITVEDFEQIKQFARGTKQQSGPKAFAPITLINPETKEQRLVTPIVDPNTGKATLQPFQIPEGFEPLKETPGFKRSADVAASTQKATEKLEADLKFKPRTAAQIKLAEQSTKRADSHFTQIEKIKTNVLNLQDARRQVVAGAGTGPIEKLLPSFRSASVALDSAVGRLGLDVVQSTTFGALSKGELDLSKDIALPTGLEGDDLIKWIDERIAAQTNVANYLERQAVFLSETDENGDQNTVAGWVKQEKEIMKNILDSQDITEEDILETIKANPDMNNRGDVLRELRRRFESGGT